jgi:hypothetical protein
MSDTFQGYRDSVALPSRNPFVITPHDSNELAIVPKAIRAPSDGVITLRGIDSSTDVPHPVLAGEVINVRAQYVRATGTTVTGTIIGYA